MTRLCRRVLLANRRARPGGLIAPGRCDDGIARQCGDVQWGRRAGGYGEFPAIAGHALYASRGHGRQSTLDFNDLSAGIVAAEKSIASYYIIGYYTTNEALDGKFRRVKVTLKNDVQATLDFRQGYYAGKVFGKFTAADKERQIEDALMLGDPITELQSRWKSITSA